MSDDAGHYQPGDPAPAGYLQWHEWAAVQEKAGYRQSQCRGCGKWLFPQEQPEHTCRTEGEERG